MAAVLASTSVAVPSKSWDWARRNPTIMIGGAILAMFVLIAFFAPWLAGDPLSFDPLNRLKRPSGEFWFGTDQFGRDVYSRVVYGTRVSLIVGVTVAIIATAVGLVLGVPVSYTHLTLPTSDLV